MGRLCIPWNRAKLYIAVHLRAEEDGGMDKDEGGKQQPGVCHRGRLQR